MKLQSLNGTWLYRIGQGKESPRTVPFSSLPVGHSECRRFFVPDRSYDHIFLRFDGIAYAGDAYLNGTLLGSMLPYSEYTFEITDLLRDGENEVKVLLEDITPVFGPSEGWENYGGIIHDVNLLYATKTYVKDAFFHCRFDELYQTAFYKVDVTAEAPERTPYTVTLFREGNAVASYTAKVGDEAEEHKLESVALWSPDSPTLYRLTVSLGEDVYETNVGFREFTCNDHEFLLNGKPTFLLGVCKHEMVGESGHTPTEAEIERDLHIIRSLGCNFVRLVHYPHGKTVLDLCDKLGLLVSEEPGLWWSDTANEEIANGSLEVLRRTVLRDRNHPSVVFYLSFNECYFTEEYLSAAVRVSKANDPTRLSSGANCMGDEETKEMFPRCGLDFYTTHPYSQTVQRLENSAETLVGKPLLLTEWGGHYVFDNPKLFREFILRMGDLHREGKLAGATYWCFADMYEFARRAPAAREGILREGLMDLNRNPNMIFDVFREAWKEALNPASPESRYWFSGEIKPAGTPLTHTGGGGTMESVLEAMRREIPRYNLNKKTRRFKVGPYLQEESFPGAYKTPLVLSDTTTLTFSGGSFRDLVLYGSVGMPKGYPIDGEYGETAAEVTVTLENGEALVFPLRNGMEFTTAMMTFGPSRLNPVAENAVPVATFGYEKNHEYYLINRLVLSLPKTEEVASVSIRSLSKDYELLFYSVFGE